MELTTPQLTWCTCVGDSSIVIMRSRDRIPDMPFFFSLFIQHWPSEVENEERRARHYYLFQAQGLKNGEPPAGDFFSDFGKRKSRGGLLIRQSWRSEDHAGVN